MEGPDDLLVDDWAAKAKDLKVGDTYNVLSHDWRVVGIVEHGKGARLFVPLTTLQNLVGARDKASIFLVKCTRPEHTDAVMEEMRHLLHGVTGQKMAHFFHHGVGVLGPRTFDQKDGSFIVRSHEVLQIGQSHEITITFAVLDDSDTQL